MLLLAREYSYRSQVLNPAFSLAFEFFFAAFNNQWFLFEYAWATILSPFIGAGLAVLFFELFYRKFIIIYKKRQTEEEGYAKLNESEVWYVGGMFMCEGGCRGGGKGKGYLGGL